MLSKKIQSFDVETTGLNPYLGAQIFAFCIGHGDTGKVEVFRLDEKNPKLNTLALQRLRKFFADTTIEKVAHNYKFELGFLKMLGIDIPENTVWHDTMIMAQIYRNDEIKYSLDYLCWKYGKYVCSEDAIVEKQARARGSKEHPRFDLVDRDVMYRYQVADGERPLLLYGMYHDALLENPLLYADYLNEIALVRVTQEMEQRGLLYSVKEGTKLHWFLDGEDAVAMKTILDNTNNPQFNLDSPKQLADLLYIQLKLPIIAYTDGGSPSTNKDTLMTLDKEYKHPILTAILKHRSYSDGIDFLANYRKFADETNHVHPTINTNQASTGRETCEKPNLQNVGKDGESEKKPYPVPLRKAFRADPDHVLLFVDYAGIEMRLIIDATQEPELLQMLTDNPDADFHYPTMECFLGTQEAAAMKHDDPKRFKALRGLYKNTGFGVAYGASPEKVARTLGRPFDEIEEGESAYRKRFPRIAGFSRQLIAQIKKDGYITTAFGRKLYIPKNKAYIGSNYIIQGTAAGILKRAQVRTRRWLRDRGVYDRFFPLLPVHDEIIFSMHRSLLPDMNTILQSLDQWCMIDMPEIKVPLRTEWKMSTTSWANAKEIKIGAKI